MPGLLLYHLSQKWNSASQGMKCIMENKKPRYWLCNCYLRDETYWWIGVEDGID